MTRATMLVDEYPGPIRDRVVLGPNHRTSPGTGQNATCQDRQN